MRRFFLATLILLPGLATRAQQPVSWTFSAKNTSDKMYEVTMTATVTAPWHIYSQTTPDGGPLATAVTYSKNPFLSIEGKAKEVGIVITKFEDVFGINVVYFNSTVSFVQKVKVEKKVKTSLTGTIEYMVCNDTQCLPPKEVPFSIALK